MREQWQQCIGAVEKATDLEAVDYSIGSDGKCGPAAILAAIISDSVKDEWPEGFNPILGPLGLEQFLLDRVLNDPETKKLVADMLRTQHDSSALSQHVSFDENSAWDKMLTVFTTPSGPKGWWDHIQLEIFCLVFQRFRIKLYAHATPSSNKENKSFIIGNGNRCIHLFLKNAGNDDAGHYFNLAIPFLQPTIVDTPQERMYDPLLKGLKTAYGEGGFEAVAKFIHSIRETYTIYGVLDEIGEYSNVTAILYKILHRYRHGVLRCFEAFFYMDGVFHELEPAGEAYRLLVEAYRSFFENAKDSPYYVVGSLDRIPYTCGPQSSPPPPQPPTAAVAENSSESGDPAPFSENSSESGDEYSHVPVTDTNDKDGSRRRDVINQKVNAQNAKLTEKNVITELFRGSNMVDYKGGSFVMVRASNVTLSPFPLTSHHSLFPNSFTLQLQPNPADSSRCRLFLDLTRRHIVYKYVIEVHAIVATDTMLATRTIYKDENGQLYVGK